MTCRHCSLTLNNSVSSPFPAPVSHRRSTFSSSSSSSLIVVLSLLALSISRSHPNFVAAAAFSITSALKVTSPSSSLFSSFAFFEFSTRRRSCPSSCSKPFGRRRSVFKMSTTGSGNVNDDDNDNEKRPSPPPAALTVIKILCLHGKYENGRSFLNRALLPLRVTLEERRRHRQRQQQQRQQQQRHHNDHKEHYLENVQIQWEELTAPFPIDPKSAPFSNENVNEGFQWWTLPEGVRSFEATEVGHCSLSS